jgi:CHASE3 domain sensor protein
MFKKRRIGRRLLLAFGVVLALLVLASGLAVYELTRMGGDFDKVVTARLTFTPNS